MNTVVRLAFYFCLAVLVGCKSNPIFTTIVKNPIFADAQKKIVNRNTPFGIISYNNVELLADMKYIPKLDNGKVVNQKKSDNDTWKDSDSYTYTNGKLNETNQGSRKFINKYEGNQLKESMYSAYTYINGKVSERRNISTDETFVYSYPNEGCVETYHESTKTDFKLRRIECKDIEGHILNNEEHVDRDGGNTSKTINHYSYTNGNLSSHVYQEFKENKMTRNVLRTYEYKNGLLTKIKAEAKVLNLSTEELFKYEIRQDNPLIICTYKQRGSKPFEKLRTISFDTIGRIVEMIDHRGDEYSMRYRIE